MSTPQINIHLEHEYTRTVTNPREWSNKLLRSCDRNSDFFLDLNRMEVSELDGIIRFIVRSVCKQFCSCLCAFNIQIRCRLIHWLFNKAKRFNGLETNFLSLIHKNPRSRFNLELIMIFFQFRTLKVGCFADLMVGSTPLLFFYCFFWRSSLLECWIRSYIQSNWFSCLSGLGRRYTRPGRWIHLLFRGHWPYRLRSNNGSCSRTNAWQLSTYPRRRIPAFVPHGFRASLCVSTPHMDTHLEHG
jgi:hypothetical protein